MPKAPIRETSYLAGVEVLDLGGRDDVVVLASRTRPGPASRPWLSPSTAAMAISLARSILPTDEARASFIDQELSSTTTRAKGGYSFLGSRCTGKTGSSGVPR